MTTEQQNRLAMFAATRALLASAPATNGLPGFAARFGTFCALLDKVPTLEAAQAASLRSQIAQRRAALDAMMRAALALAGIGLSHADAEGDPGLVLKLRVAPRDFVRARLIDRPVIARRIVDAIQPLLPALAAHGMTAARVEDVQEKIDDAAEHVTGSRTTVAAKSAATQRLAALFRELSRVLSRQIDPLVASLRETAPEFHARYRTVRQIVDRPATLAAVHREPEPAREPQVA